MSATGSSDVLRFDNRVAIVTGAGRGMGREHAKLLAARGAKVVVNDLGAATAGGGSDPEPANSVVAEIRAAGGTAVADTNTVATPEGAKAIVQTAIDNFGALDIVINVAGVFETLPVEETDYDNFMKHVHSNFVGAASVSFAAWPHLVASGSGRIINTQSSAGILGLPGRVSYGASKTGNLGLTKCLAHDGHDLGIKVNLVNPGARTRMWIDPATGQEMKEVPSAPTDGSLDPYRPEIASPIYIVLAHETCPTSGEMYNCGAGRICRQFIADTPGFSDPNLTPEMIVSRWDEVIDEEDYFAPTYLRSYRGM